MTDETRTNFIEDADDLVESRALDDAVVRGELTSVQAAELLQQSARRRTAEDGPAIDTDTDGTITTGGFGSGQGMAPERTGQ